MANFNPQQQPAPEMESEENWELEADPERPSFSLNHGFFKPTPLRHGLVCFFCKTEGHRQKRCPVKEGLPKDFLIPFCQRCERKGHATKHCAKTPIRTHIQETKSKQTQLGEWFPQDVKRRTIDSPKYIMKIGEKKFETRIDTGNSMSFIDKTIYETLPHKPRMLEQNIEYLATDGFSVQIEGVIQLESEIGGLSISQKYALIKDLNPPVILGMDWVSDNQVQLYSRAMKVKGELLLPTKQ